ncbi:unnamed protein product [Rhizophagus irregularis]|nr:hypothetical protein RhiirB3_433867 [Rhizophagus irregularis]CAB5217449.1 unnamed protein product [Rhizophagus irregularis]
MSKLNTDILYLIFEELQYDKDTLYSCLLTNKICCEIIIPILWKNPWYQLNSNNKKSLLLNVIISHLSDESKNKLKNQGINFLETTLNQKPLFDYIKFCKHLNLYIIFEIIDNVYNIIKHISMIKKEIIILFINKNIEFTHFYTPQTYNYQIINISEVKHLFSELQFLNCSNTDKNIWFLLKDICQSIKELDLIIEKPKINIGIIKLIESQKNLKKVNFDVVVKRSSETCKILENSLIKHANNIQHFRTTKPPVTKILSSFVNLKILELDNHFYENWNCLEDLSLPLLQNLKASHVPIKALTNFINNTNGYLTKIDIDLVSHNKNDNKRIIQAIYQNCLNLKYLKLTIRSENIKELETLLIRCQHLNRLIIIIDNADYIFNWIKLFKVLTNSSPIKLFMFKFWVENINRSINLDYLKFFFDNWKERPPISFQLSRRLKSVGIDNLIKKYKAEGIIAKYDNFCENENENWNFFR